MSMKFVAISTQSVGVGPGGSTSMLARVSIVNYLGAVELDVLVRPTLPVSDYRTPYTGIEAHHLNSAEAVPFDDVQRRVANFISNKVLVGHALWNDLSVLGLPHPAVTTRDVALYRPFREALKNPSHVVGLPTLVWHLMLRKIQVERVDPLENARAVVDLYRSILNECDDAIKAGAWPFELPPKNFARCYL